MDVEFGPEVTATNSGGFTPEQVAAVKAKNQATSQAWQDQHGGHWWNNPYLWMGIGAAGMGAGAAGWFGGAGSSAGAAGAAPALGGGSTLAANLGSASVLQAGAGTTGAGVSTLGTIKSGLGAAQSAKSVYDQYKGGGSGGGGNTLADLASLIGAATNTAANNRTTSGNFAQQYDRNMLLAQQDRRAQESDALRKLAITNYLKSGGNTYDASKAGIPYSYGFGPKGTSPAQQQAASSLEAEMLKRATPEGSYTPVPLDTYSKASGLEKAGNVSSSVLAALAALSQGNQGGSGLWGKLWNGLKKVGTLGMGGGKPNPTSYDPNTTTGQDGASWLELMGGGSADPTFDSSGGWLGVTGGGDANPVQVGINPWLLPQTPAPQMTGVGMGDPDEE
jgi:hypothetical protein